jgi:hypothetical protein
VSVTPPATSNTIAPTHDPVWVRAQEIAGELLGSHSNLSDQFRQGEEGDMKLLRALDSLTIECETCGVWVATDDRDENGNCTDCTNS